MNDNIEGEYINKLEPKLVKILSLIERYKAAQEYSEVAKRHLEVLEQSKKIEEKNKKLKHLLEVVRRPEDKPEIRMEGNKAIVSLTDPFR